MKKLILFLFLVGFVITAQSATHDKPPKLSKCEITAIKAFIKAKPEYKFDDAVRMSNGYIGFKRKASDLYSGCYCGSWNLDSEGAGCRVCAGQNWYIVQCKDCAYCPPQPMIPEDCLESGPGFTKVTLQH